MAAPKRTRKRYSPVEIQSALTTLAYFGGNSVRASEQTGVSDDTLRAWRLYDHADLYLEIQEREGPKLEAIAAGQAREVILRVADTEHRILDRLAADEIDPETGEVSAPSSKTLSELAGALQRVTTAKGINTTKLLELTGRPTSIVQHLDPKQEAQALARRLGVALETTGHNIPQLPASESLPLVTETNVANAREAVPASTA